MKRIGILLRNEENNYLIKNEIINYLKDYDVNLIGIIDDDSNNFSKVIDTIKLCDGIILPGGNDESKFGVKLAKYLYDINKPTLGICLGMQNMAEAFDGKIEKLSTNFHNNNLIYSHKIIIKKGTLLYKILGVKSILVNSSHNYNVTDTKLNISSYSDDCVIESIEDNNKKFYLGVQFHPERLTNDLNSKLMK